MLGGWTAVEARRIAVAFDAGRLAWYSWLTVKVCASETPRLSTKGINVQVACGWRLEFVQGWELMSFSMFKFDLDRFSAGQLSGHWASKYQEVWK
jgi:hypothetical protein